jgi:UDP-2,3-diacylglucosamine hydrolase
MHHYTTHQKIVFVSDVHLRDQFDPNVARLSECLNRIADKVDAIYILGDLFDFWISAGCVHTHSQILSSLRDITRRCPIYFMPGNRDFFMTPALCRRFGMKKIPDPYMIQHGEKRILLTHGDLLCTSDRSYQLMRRILQNSLIKGLHAIIPSRIITFLTRKIQSACRQSKRRKSPQRMQADDATVRTWFQRYQPDVLIYGHVHVPNHYCLLDTGVCGEVIVLDTWDNQANYCLVAETSPMLVSDSPVT